jgi:hypothetical protein
MLLCPRDFRIFHVFMEIIIFASQEKSLVWGVGWSKLPRDLHLVLPMPEEVYSNNPISELRKRYVRSLQFNLRVLRDSSKGLLKGLQECMLKAVEVSPQMARTND